MWDGEPANPIILHRGLVFPGLKTGKPLDIERMRSPSAFEPVALCTHYKEESQTNLKVLTTYPERMLALAEVTLQQH